MKKRKNLQYLLSFITDFVSVAISCFLTWWFFDCLLQRVPFTTQNKYQFFTMVGIAYFIAFLCFDQSTNITKRTKAAEFLISAKYNLLSFVLLISLMFISKARMLDSRIMSIGVPLCNLFVMFLSHQALKLYLKKFKASRGAQDLVGIISTIDRVQPIVKDLEGDWTKTIIGVALLDAEKSGETVNGVAVKANYETCMDWVRSESMDEVYIDLPYDRGDSLLLWLRELESMGVSIHLNLPQLRRFQMDAQQQELPCIVQERLETIAGNPTVVFGAKKLSFSQQAAKRTLDIIGAAVGCLISAPILLLVFLPQQLESPGPFFFRQKRVGLNGRVFEIYKVRSMYADAEKRKDELMQQNEMKGLMFKMENDPRITKVGKLIRKTSIDELPQFFNVLRGDMSLVGTRPPTLDEYRQYSSHHKRRLSMKPGITGLWQVSGRSNVQDFEEIVRLDVKYIDNWSFWNDIRLLVKTVGVVLLHQGAE